MRWRSIRICIIVLLIVLNAGIGVYLWQEEEKRTVISDDRLAAVKLLYEEAGISWEIETEVAHPDRGYLLLDEPDTERIVQKLLGSSYTETYLYGSRVKYEGENKEVVVDREVYTLQYYNSQEGLAVDRNPSADVLIESAAEEFVRSVFSEQIDVILEGKEKEENTWKFVFHQLWHDKHLMFNRMEVTMEGMTVRRMTVKYYQPWGESEDTYPAYPIDELLYRCYHEVGKYGGEQVRKLVDIRYEYQLGDGKVGIPSVTFVFDNGWNYTYKQIDLDRKNKD